MQRNPPHIARRLDSSAASSEPVPEPSIDIAPAPSDRGRGSQASSNATANAAAVRTPSSNSTRSKPYPYPFDRLQGNWYVESIQDVSFSDTIDHTTVAFIASDAVGCIDPNLGAFFIRKKREGEEIQVDKLDPKLQKLFVTKGGSREKEWTRVCAPGSDGPAVRVHRGAKARELRKKYPNRIIPSRWHDKWKDMGADYDNGLKHGTIPKHMGAKSRWISQGFHDPDITHLNRTVPTPTTADVPLGLQMLASIQALAWVGDVSSAFTQGLKGQRTQPLFADPPKGGFPGETDPDILIELLAEIYGLITGPPAWRKSLLVTLKELGFKRHPLAPCLALMYEHTGAPDNKEEP